MSNMLRTLKNSRILTWGALVLIVILLCMSFSTEQPWWSYMDFFCAFMMTFCRLAALYIHRFSLAAYNKLNMCAIIFGILTLLSFIGIFIANQVIYA